MNERTNGRQTGRSAVSQTIEINGETYAKVTTSGDRVLVRCRNAGVWAGTHASRNVATLTLERANRIWRWRGANTLSEVAVNGVNRDGYTRIATEVPEVVLTATDVCEVIPIGAGVDLTEVWHG